MLFFTRQKKQTFEINAYIEETKKILNDERYNQLSDYLKLSIIKAIEKRSKSFLERIEQYAENPGYEYRKLNNAYYNYAVTVHECLKNPDKANFYITAYYFSSDYIHVDSKNSHTVVDDIVEDLITAAMVTIFAGLLILSLNLLAGGIILAVAATLLIPLICYNLAETKNNKAAVKETEDECFADIQSLQFNQSRNVKGKFIEFFEGEKPEDALKDANLSLTPS